MKIIQKGFNYSQDGPGNRLVYHMQGCNMHCPWCANPEGISILGSTMKVKDGNTGKFKELLSYKEYSIDELFDEIMRSKMMFFENGGVTFTGGEPTMQFDELKALMNRLKASGIHIAMENNGTSLRLNELVPMIDYLIMDFKHPNDEIHKRITGISNDVIKKNIIDVLNMGRQLALRIPLIHGFNDTEEALSGYVDFFTEYATDNMTVEILPYHEFGKEKWEQCGLLYKVENGFVSDMVVKDFEDKFREIGINVIHT